MVEGPFPTGVAYQVKTAPSGVDHKRGTDSNANSLSKTYKCASKQGGHYDKPLTPHKILRRFPYSLQCQLDSQKQNQPRREDSRDIANKFRRDHVKNSREHNHDTSLNSFTASSGKKDGIRQLLKSVNG